jgi:hypothetical protein
MPDAPIDNRTLLRRTLVMMGAMVGACVLLVGTLTLVAVVVVGRAASRDAEAVPDTASAHAKPAATAPREQNKVK